MFLKPSRNKILFCMQKTAASTAHVTPASLVSVLKHWEEEVQGLLSLGAPTGAGFAEPRQRRIINVLVT